MKVTIIGCGHVGLVTGAGLADFGHEVVGYDADQDKLASLERGDAPFFEPGLDELLERHHGGNLRFTGDVTDALRDAEVAFICVGTPSRPDGKLSLAYVEQATRDVAEAASGPLVIVEKSTVPVHTARRIVQVLEEEGRYPEIEVATNPEFLREGSAVSDALSPDRIVVGLADRDVRARDVLDELYAPVLAHAGCPIIFTDLETAELIKHASNSFLAMKVSYINAVARMCEKTGANVDLVTQGMALDPRIGPHHLHAGVGYGGSCFPKDVSAFIAQANDLGLDFSFLDAVRRINDEQRLVIVDKVRQAAWNLEGKTIGVWGLAFKPKTDDLRESPALDVIPALEAEGASVRAYDPAAGTAAKAELPSTEIAASPLAAAEGADVLVVLTDWEEFAAVDLEKLKEAMRRPAVIDGRNIWPIERMAELGFTYLSFGRPDVIAGEIRRP